MSLPCEWRNAVLLLFSLRWCGYLGLSSLKHLGPVLGPSFQRKQQKLPGVLKVTGSNMFPPQAFFSWLGNNNSQTPCATSFTRKKYLVVWIAFEAWELSKINFICRKQAGEQPAPAHQNSISSFLFILFSPKDLKIHLSDISYWQGFISVLISQHWIHQYFRWDRLSPELLQCWNTLRRMDRIRIFFLLYFSAKHREIHAPGCFLLDCSFALKHLRPQRLPKKFCWNICQDLKNMNCLWFSQSHYKSVRKMGIVIADVDSEPVRFDRVISSHG